MPVKKQKQKQKQKQRQSQRVVVNVNTGRAPARRRATPARRSGGGGGGVPYPIYLNSPSDLSPIIQNLPAQYQNQPAITMPTNTAPQPSPQALTYPTPTSLQAPTEDVRPLGASAKKINYTENPMRKLSPIIEEVKAKIMSPNRGLRPTPTKGNEPPTSSSPSSAFQSFLGRDQTPEIGPVIGRPRQFTDAEREARVKYNNTQEGKREMAERAMFAKEDPKSKRSLFFR